jgi:hypothetical protein
LAVFLPSLPLPSHYQTNNFLHTTGPPLSVRSCRLLPPEQLKVAEQEFTKL